MEVKQKVEHEFLFNESNIDGLEEIVNVFSEKSKLLVCEVKLRVYFSSLSSYRVMECVIVQISNIFQNSQTRELVCSQQGYCEFVETEEGCWQRQQEVGDTLLKGMFYS